MVNPLFRKTKKFHVIHILKAKFRPVRLGGFVEPVFVEILIGQIDKLRHFLPALTKTTLLNEIVLYIQLDSLGPADLQSLTCQNYAFIECRKLIFFALHSSKGHKAKRPKDWEANTERLKTNNEGNTVLLST